MIRVIVYCLSELKDGFGREISTLLLALAPSAKARGMHPSAPPPPPNKSIAVALFLGPWISLLFEFEVLYLLTKDRYKHW